MLILFLRGIFGRNLRRSNPWGDDPDEEERSWYVEGLSKHFQEKWQRAGATVTTVSTEYQDKIEFEDAVTVSPLSEPFVPNFGSFGSLGHPEVCQRPCMYFQAGLCRNGNDCTYCHLPHIEKPSKLDKKQRTLLQSLSYEEFVAFILAHIQERIKQMNLDASELLHLLEVEAAQAQAPSLPERERRNMNKVFDRMNLSSLVGMVRQKRHHQQTDSAQHIEAVMQRIRENYIPKE